MGAQQRGGEECTCCLGKADTGKEKGHGGKNKEFWLSLVLGGGQEVEWGSNRRQKRESQSGEESGVHPERTRRGSLHMGEGFCG